MKFWGDVLVMFVTFFLSLKFEKETRYFWHGKRLVYGMVIVVRLLVVLIVLGISLVLTSLKQDMFVC